MFETLNILELYILQWKLFIQITKVCNNKVATCVYKMCYSWICPYHMDLANWWHKLDYSATRICHFITLPHLSHYNCTDYHAIIDDVSKNIIISFDNLPMAIYHLILCVLTEQYKIYCWCLRLFRFYCVAIFLSVIMNKNIENEFMPLSSFILMRIIDWS